MAAGSSAAVLAGRDQSSNPARKRLFELLLAYLLILAVLWTPRFWQSRIYPLAALTIVWATYRAWPGMAEMGWTAANFLRSAWIVLVAALAGALAIVVAWHLKTLHAPATPKLFLERFVGYIVFACVQQFLLQDFFLWRLCEIGLGRRTAVVAAAGLFAAAHLPNPILTILTLIWGTVATAWFLRYRSLYSLALAHMILGVTVAICIPGPVIRNMRVGRGYLTYHRPRHVTSAIETTPYPRRRV